MIRQFSPNCSGSSGESSSIQTVLIEENETQNKNQDKTYFLIDFDRHFTSHMWADGAVKTQEINYSLFASKCIIGKKGWLSPLNMLAMGWTCGGDLTLMILSPV